MKLRVTSIQRGCVYDGPGIRTTFFLKGCALHCPWCCNPETISKNEEFFIDDSKCLLKQGINSPICSNCKRIGGVNEISKCPLNVCENVSNDYGVNELLNILLKDRAQFVDGGGITISGGEPLLQAQALLPLLKMLKKENIHVAIETTLVAPYDNFIQLKDYIDLFIVDLKLQKESVLPPGYFEEIKERLEIIRNNGVDTLYRLVVVSSMVNYVDEVISSLKSLNIDSIQLLKCHNLGGAKYRKLKIGSEDFTCDSQSFAEVSAKISRSNIEVTKYSI